MRHSLVSSRGMLPDDKDSLGMARQIHVKEEEVA